MHETLIINNILKKVNRQAKGKKIKSIILEVGDLAHLPAQELKDFLGKMVDFKVIVKPVKAKVKCVCGYQGEPKILVHEHDFILYECPKCGKTAKIVSGEEIVLKEIKTW
ncbi:hydrogenase maturation nickel metallochaperone HypA [Candidatus Woesearchaeota archaeon]|nr:hydrogenase maturation nickel metallochaperone HypA [Candidatus Woesearchaeota archaeon]